MNSITYHRPLEVGGGDGQIMRDILHEMSEVLLEMNEIRCAA